MWLKIPLRVQTSGDRDLALAHGATESAGRWFVAAPVPEELMALSYRLPSGAIQAEVVPGPCMTGVEADPELARALQITLKFAVDTLGRQAPHWLASPKVSLGWKIPAEMMKDLDGCRKVYALIRRVSI